MIFFVVHSSQNHIKGVIFSRNILVVNKIFYFTVFPFCLSVKEMAVIGST